MNSSVKKYISKIVSDFMCVFPIKSNKIIFDNFIGLGYGDNPKYVAEEIIKKNYPVDIVWLVKDINTPMPEHIRKVKISSVKALYEKATAKVWISNVRNSIEVKKRKKQIYLQLWHSPFSPKYLEMDAEQNLDKEYVERAKYDGKITDAIIVSSDLQKKQFKRTFWLNPNVEYLEYGLPRNDIFFRNNDEKITEIKKRLKIQDDEYVIMYAPTFRDDYSIEGYKLDFEEILYSFETKMNKRCKLVIRLHPNVRKQKDFIKYNESIIDCSSIEDTQYISMISDCVISDYSSIIFDFAMLNKPVFICALDLKDYEKKRGLLNEYWDLPFPISLSNEELKKEIVNFDQNNYEKEIKRYFSVYPMYDAGKASEKTVGWIMRKIHEETTEKL